jgi:phytoene synthase
MAKRPVETGEIDPADLAACRSLLRGGSKSFHAASFLLPAGVRARATALYAFCRLADDAVDLDGDPGRALARLNERLGLAYAGTPRPHPADRAFAATIARFRIPRALPEALLEGFAWDVEGRQYETIEEVQAYATRVAGSVGAMMALVMGVATAQALARACDLGIAMQLTNIARDVGEDARAGRLYLPRQWLWEAGIDPDAWLAEPSFSPALAKVIERLLSVGDGFYRRGMTGIAALPTACRPGIRAAARLYAEIGREVGRRRFDSVGARARVSVGRKLGLLPMVVIPNGSDRREAREPCVHEARFLVEAAALAQTRPPKRSRWPEFDARVEWLVDLFSRLERRDQLQRGRL